MKNNRSRLFTIENLLIIVGVVTVTYFQSPIYPIVILVYLLCFVVLVTYWRFLVGPLIGCENTRVGTMRITVTGESHLRAQFLEQIRGVANTHSLPVTNIADEVVEIHNVDIDAMNALGSITKPEGAYVEIEETKSKYIFRKKMATE